DMWFGLQPLLKRKRNVRLADARLSGQHHGTTFALRGIAPAAREHLDFVVAPEQRRQSGGVLRFKAAASRSFRRCPTIPMPKSFKSSAVKLGRTVSSISFSRNAASYLSRPRPRSQLPTSIIAP